MNKTLWKSMLSGMKSAHGEIDWRIGKWQKTDKPLIMGQSGFHASENIINAMEYVNCAVLARVEVRGKFLSQMDKMDKQVWSEMRVIEAFDWTSSDSVRLAIFAQAAKDYLSAQAAVAVGVAGAAGVAVAAGVAWAAVAAWVAGVAGAAVAAGVAWAAVAAGVAGDAAGIRIITQCHNFVLSILEEKKNEKSQKE